MLRTWGWKSWTTRIYWERSFRGAFGFHHNEIWIPVLGWLLFTLGGMSWALVYALRLRANTGTGVANLRGADLVGADLRETNLIEGHLLGVVLIEAALITADLRQADLRGAVLSAAILRGADLGGADLSTAKGLTQPQINEARGDRETKLPEEFQRPPHWLQKSEAQRSDGRAPS